MTFKSLKQILEEAVVRDAMRIAWDELSEKDKKKFLKMAKKAQGKRNEELAIKCMEDADRAMSAPGYVSRADPAAYKK